MKKILPLVKILAFTIILFLSATIKESHGQYVNIPDPNFSNYLMSNFPGCIAGGMLDTTCIAVLNTTDISCVGLGITDLTGIQYFDSLKVLDCSGNGLSFLPPLPSSLQTLNCDGNNLTSLPFLPATLRGLYTQNNYILGTLPALPSTLDTLDCWLNNLTSLPVLPGTLMYLDFNSISITS